MTRSTLPRRPWSRWFRPQDVVWLLLFGALAWANPSRSPVVGPLLACLAAVQVAETRLLSLQGSRGSAVSIALKLLFTYLLLGYTGGLNSSYFLLLLFPIVSAATTLGALGTFIFTTASCASYLSFLLFLDWTRYEIPPDQVRELLLRLSFLPVAAFLTYQLAEANRVAARKYQAVAEELATANRNLREAEVAYRRSERLAALGQLTAGLAHEMRNPLGTIRASSEMLAKNLPADSEVARELAGFITSEADRTNSLVTRFLEFARPLSLRRNPTNVHEAIDCAVVEIERHNPPFQVSVHKNYSPDVPPVSIDSEWMVRVFFNLLLNAVEASPLEGAITIKTRLTGQDVEIAVIDRGSGIEPQHLESIFNPFFTTKPEGVGLGLAIVSKIVDEHGGRLAVESEPCKGSIFRVYLPVDAAAQD